jgi:Mn2+/Fe2+ NRAMP family transporter
MTDQVQHTHKISLFALILPGLLVAATGVGAGDLATASFAGSLLGNGILWAAVLGAFLKFVVNEGLARWQLATGNTLIEGAVDKFGRVFGWLFLPYLFIWSFFVASALMSACGVTLHAMIPFFETADEGKIGFGVLASVVGIALVYKGGYPLFEKVMSVCIGVMFVTVVITAGLLWPGTGEFVRGLFVPSIPELGGNGLTWTVALIGGVGGTVTVLCYGYWIREEGRTGGEYLRTCRIDLGVAYTMTAVFGVAMIIIGNNIEIEGGGATLVVNLSEQLAGPLGPPGKWLFLIGAAGAVFSSLLGVWQATPYIFADAWTLLRRRNSTEEVLEEAHHVDTKSLPYRSYLFAIGIIPMLGLVVSFQEIQKLYAVIGAAFIPLITLGLLIMNSRADWVGEEFKNRRITDTVLLIILGFFAWIAWETLVS